MRSFPGFLRRLGKPGIIFMFKRLENELPRSKLRGIRPTLLIKEEEGTVGVFAYRSSKAEYDGLLEIDFLLKHK
jgi:hypothetical protein